MNENREKNCKENSTQNSNRCYARAMPTDGSHGGQAWGGSKLAAEGLAMATCRKFSAETGGDPNTCRIVESDCNSAYPAAARLLPDEPIEAIGISDEGKDRE